MAKVKAFIGVFFNASRDKYYMSIWQNILFVLGTCFIMAIVAFAGLCVYWLQDLPECESVNDFNVNLPTEVYANDGETLLAKFQLENRTPLESLDQISPYVVQGTVATEDERFYSHIGIDPISIIRAIINNATGGTLEGASTITQQLVRNTVLADEMNEITLKRKVREAVVAMQMESVCSKDEILLMYLNTVNYGSGAYGIEAAAQRYYSKHADELTLAEAAMLIGIPQSPSHNSPLNYEDNAVERRNIVLKRMVNNHVITQEEADEIVPMGSELDPSDISSDGILLYPYFTSYVRKVLQNGYDLSTDQVFQGGLKVYTTLDPTLQEYAEEACEDKEDSVSSALEVAMTVVEPDTGYVVAMVGGKDYYEDQWNLAAQGKRQAGSSFKTFTLVAALEDGISPNTMVDCGPSVTLKGSNHMVSNYGKSDYGVLPIRSAFAVSSNTGFTRLIAAVGPEKVVEVAHRMGIKSELGANTSLTLGTSEVTTLEMAEAYATLATGGIHRDAVVIAQVYDRNGNLLVDNTNQEGERVLEPEIAHAATEVMKGVITGGTATGARLDNGQPVAGKTGTSQNYMDSWFVGITPQYSVALWMGDRYNKVPAYQTVTSVFPAFMNPALEGREVEDFPWAEDPVYTRHFSNADLDLGSSSVDEEEEKKKKEEEEKKKAEEEARKKAEEEARQKEQQQQGGDDPGGGDNPGGGDDPGGGDNPGGGDDPGGGDNPGGGGGEP